MLARPFDRRLVAIALLLSPLACAKKEPPPPTRACVLTTSDGSTTGQCFEYTENRPRKDQERQCSEFEAFSGGKKTLVDGPCPMQGRGGVCLPVGMGAKSVCYGAPELCKSSCKGTYARE